MKHYNVIALLLVVAVLLSQAAGCGTKRKDGKTSEIAYNDYLNTEEGYDKELFYRNLGTIQAADPSVILVGDTFYLYATNAEDTGSCNDICAWSSKNLTDWTEEGQVFIPARDAWAVNTLWAPEVIEREGRYYMYYSGYNLETAQMGIGLAVADSPAGPFHEIEGTFGGRTYSRTEMPFDFGFPVIDPSPFIDEDGSVYLYFSRDQVEYESSVFGCRLGEDMVTVLAVTEEPLVRPSQDWENPTQGKRWNEAPFMFKREGKYYLTYSANYYENSNYAVGLAVSDDPLSGFEKVDYNPILEADPDWAYVSGTGHNSFFQSPDGSELWIAYHSHLDPVNGGSQRVIKFDRVSFDNEGRLVVSGPSITPQALPAGASEYRNVAKEAHVTATEGGETERLTDGIVNYRYDNVERYEYASEGKNTITFQFDTPVKIKAVMVYDSVDYALSGDKAAVTVNGSVMELFFNPEYRYVDEYGFEVKQPASAAILEFEETETNRIMFEFPGDVNLNEIVILGK